VLAGAVVARTLIAEGYAPLLGYLSSGMLFAAQIVQWPPMFAGAFAIAPLGVIPHRQAARRPCIVRRATDVVDPPDMAGISTDAPACMAAWHSGDDTCLLSAEAR
jgi:hypothetical protein